MKTRPPLLVVLPVLGLLAGCGTYSPSDRRGEEFNNRVREAYRNNGTGQRQSEPAAYKSDGERATLYPGDTTSAEWKSLK